MYANGDGVNISDPSGYIGLGEVMMAARTGAMIGAIASVAVTKFLNPNADFEDLAWSAVQGAGMGALGGVGFGVRTASMFIAGLRTLALAGLTLYSSYEATYEAIVNRNLRAATVHAVFAVLGGLGVRATYKNWNHGIGSDPFTGHPPGQGFSGIINEAHQILEVRPSGNPTPPGGVSSQGGHGVVNGGLFRSDGSTSSFGFTAFLQENGTLIVQFLSRSVNGNNRSFDGNVPPPAAQARMLDTIQRVYGRPARAE